MINVYCIDLPSIGELLSRGERWCVRTCLPVCITAVPLDYSYTYRPIYSIYRY